MDGGHDLDSVARHRAAGGGTINADVPVLPRAPEQRDQRGLLPRSGGGHQRPAADGVHARGGTASNVAGAWTTRTVNLNAFAGQTVQLRFEAVDAGTASLIEAGFDNVVVTRQ